MQVTERLAEELFRFLRPEQVVRLNRAAEPVSFKPGDVVYESDAPATYMYVVISGKIALHVPSDDGLNVLVNEVGTGQLFGVCVCLGVECYTTTAMCSEHAWLLRIEAAVLKRLMDQDVEIGYALQTEIARIYFGRYVDAIRRLSGVLVHVGAGCPIR
jgi:CRP-like cAMP-binding protein